jgi:hypothetical protein
MIKCWKIAHSHRIPSSSFFAPLTRVANFAFAHKKASTEMGHAKSSHKTFMNMEMCSCNKMWEQLTRHVQSKFDAAHAWTESQWKTGAALACSDTWRGRKGLEQKLACWFGFGSQTTSIVVKVS